MPSVWIVGLGPGNMKMCTIEVKRVICSADVFIGASRLIDTAQSFASENADCAHLARRIEEINPTKIRKALDELDFEVACVVCSGDSGYYSLATSVREALDGYEVKTLPGITSVQAMAACLGRPWQNCALRSAHGKNCNILGEVLASPEVFFLTGGDIVPKTIARELDGCGLGFVEMAIAERLSYPDQKVCVGCASDFVNQEFDSLSCVWIRRPKLADDELDGYGTLTCGIADDAFVRGKVPMTKQEVRACSMAKLGLKAGDVVYDVGAGTGSLSIEAALASPMNKVYAIETNEEGCTLIDINRRRFGAYNIEVVYGLAPDAFANLPAPDAAFIGGSKGNLQEILEALLKKNPGCKIVVSAIALETIAQAQNIFEAFVNEGRLENFEVSFINVSRAHKAGSYHLMMAQNPIAVFSAHGTCGVAGTAGSSETVANSAGE